VETVVGNINFWSNQPPRTTHIEVMVLPPL